MRSTPSFGSAGVKILTTGCLTLVACAAVIAAQQQPARPATAGSKIVLLGTGTPAPTPDRSGPATAIVVNDTAYLVDFGPGVVRRASAAAAGGIAALQPTRLQRAFVTHLHSDHTVGYADLIFTPWTLGRRMPLEVYGPRGIAAMTSHLIEAYRVDIDTRTNADGNQRTFPDGHKVNAHEIGAAGVVYKDANVTVTAFATKHAMESYGYRFDTPDRSIVISGDTNPAQSTIDACRGCDVLIHEVHTEAWLAARPEAGGAPPGTFRRFSEKYHTTVPQLAELARQAKPRLLILYHYNSLTPDELQTEMMKHYAGHFVIGRDLDVY